MEYFGDIKTIVHGKPIVALLDWVNTYLTSYRSAHKVISTCGVALRACPLLFLTMVVGNFGAR